MSGNQIRLHHEGANRFWELQRVGARLVVRFGRIGEEGTEREIELRTPVRAFFTARQKSRRMWCKGYRPVDTGHGVCAIAVFLASPEACRDLGRWLEARDDPRGEELVACAADRRKYGYDLRPLFRRARRILDGIPDGVAEAERIDEFAPPPPTRARMGGAFSVPANPGSRRRAWQRLVGFLRRP